MPPFYRSPFYRVVEVRPRVLVLFPTHLLW